MTRISLAVSLVAIVGPSVAFGQDVTVSGAATLGLGFHDVSDVPQDLRTTSLDGRLGVDFGNGLALGVEAGVIGIDIDDVPFDLNADFIGLRGSYAFGNGMSLGLYHERLTLGADVLPIDITLKSTGVSAGYATGDLTLGAFVGQSETSPSLGSDIDFRDAGLNAKYAMMPNLTLGAAFQRTTIDTPGTDVDLDFLGLAAAYSVNDKLSVFGGLSRTSLDIVDLDATTMGLGLGYSLADMIGFNATASMELARTDLSAGGLGAGDLDTVRFGLTVPLGAGSTEAPLNSVADSVFNPRHSAINAGLTSAF